MIIIAIQVEAKKPNAGTNLLPHCGQTRFMMKVPLRDMFIVYNANIEIALFYFFLLCLETIKVCTPAHKYVSMWES